MSPIETHATRDAGELGCFVELALGGLRREYPCGIAWSLRGDTDLRPPREQTPAFYGCYDWHSAVHAHWTLVRALRHEPAAPWVARAREALDRSLTVANLRAERAFLEPRPGFERPYGLAWLTTLYAELATWNDVLARRWAAALEPLAALAVTRLRDWLGRLPYPIRSGVHSQTAFAMGLLLDACDALGDGSTRRHVAERAHEWHGADRDLPLRLEPSADDFLSPALGVADLMRRVLPTDAFVAWLARALPTVHLEPVRCPDASDGRLAHLEGLNLSRAWMLDAIAAALPANDPRIEPLRRMASKHEDAGLDAFRHDDYALTHWLGTFAVYQLTHPARAMRRAST
ncbi:MAG: DUF2891 domain-containing protein [Myxococcales bacterium]|nr:DUF2891 domain-containing protein [Myxococcales bacterium]